MSSWYSITATGEWNPKKLPELPPFVTEEMLATVMKQQKANAIYGTGMDARKLARYDAASDSLK
jgi:hypothetical protein